MLERRIAWGLLLGACGLLSVQVTCAVGADVVTVVDEADGIRYQVTTRTQQRVISETTVVEQPRTVAQEKITNQTKQATRAYSVPVTQWVAEPYVTNPWAVFTPPVVAYRYVPVTHWETKTEQYQVQVPSREYEQVTQKVKVPVTNQKVVEEKFYSKVALGPTPSKSLGGSSDKAIAGGLEPAGAATNMAARSVLGGTRLDSDLRGPGTNDFHAAEPGRLK